MQYSTVHRYAFSWRITVMIDIDTSWDWIAIYGPVQYSTVQYSTVQYITTVISGSRHYRPAPSSAYAIHLVYWHQSYNYNEAIRRKWIQSPSKRRSDVTPGGAGQPPFRCNSGWSEPLYTALILESFFLPWAMFCVYGARRPYTVLYCTLLYCTV